MIFLFTDFTDKGPYLGQMRAALLLRAGNVPVVDLMHDVPAFRCQAGGHLLAACAPHATPGSVFLCVVDPGVGTERRALALEADGRVFVGPDNGLLEVVGARATSARWWEITWSPESLSSSFHGRDLFAPVAARLALGESPAAMGRSIEAPSAAAGHDLAEIIYIDGFGNAMTGVRAASLPVEAVISVGDRALEYRRTFAAAAPGEVFWYANSLGLVEVAANGDSAALQLGLSIGDPLAVRRG